MSIIITSQHAPSAYPWAWGLLHSFSLLHKGLREAAIKWLMEKISKRYRRHRFKNENPQSLREHIFFYVPYMVKMPRTNCFFKCLRRSKSSIYLYLHIVPSCGCLWRDYTWISMALCSEGQPSWATGNVTFAARLQKRRRDGLCLPEAHVWWSYQNTPWEKAMITQEPCYSE